GWTLAAVCVMCFSLLQIFYVPLPLPNTPAAHAGLDEMVRWVVYVMLAGLVLWFALRLNELRGSHYRHIEAEAEESARERYLLGLATLAAGTAHEMSTPLSTMSVVVGDLRRSKQPPADWKEHIDLLWQQLQLCRHSLSGLARASDLEQLGKAHVVPARAFVEGLAARFRLLRPEVALGLHYTPDDEALALRVDLTLEQALLSLVNNAADASPEVVELRVGAAGGMLVIDILDRGPGISPQLRERLGRGPVGSRPGGHGLGLLIANSAIERLGGSVQLSDRDGGGTCARVELPLHAAAPAAGRDYQGASVAAA
ncbi:MAG TPA: HAMP domain-containing sensor histidine kinase, partial [Burkholderiales bacterium]